MARAAEVAGAAEAATYAKTDPDVQIVRREYLFSHRCVERVSRGSCFRDTSNLNQYQAVIVPRQSGRVLRARQNAGPLVESLRFDAYGPTRIPSTHQLDTSTEPLH